MKGGFMSLKRDKTRQNNPKIASTNGKKCGTRGHKSRDPRGDTLLIIKLKAELIQAHRTISQLQGAQEMSLECIRILTAKLNEGIWTKLKYIINK